MTDIIEAIEEDLEGVFKPRPGGLVDMHRKERARREEAARERENADERQEEHGYKTVKTTSLSPEVTVGNSVFLQPGTPVMVLPNSPYRYRATIISTIPVTLAKDANAALGGAGFPLPPNTPYVIRSRAQLWAISVPLFAPAIPVTSNMPLQNTTPYGYQVTLTGGSGITVYVNNVAAGYGTGTYFVPSGGIILLTYTTMPAWTWAFPAAYVSVLSELYAPEA